MDELDIAAMRRGREDPLNLAAISRKAKREGNELVLAYLGRMPSIGSQQRKTDYEQFAELVKEARRHGRLERDPNFVSEEDGMIDSMRGVLRNLGYETLKTRNGETALGRVPDYVVLKVYRKLYNHAVKKGLLRRI